MWHLWNIIYCTIYIPNILIWIASPWCCIIHITKFGLPIHGLWIYWLDLCCFKPILHFSLDNNWSNVLSTHLTNVVLFGSFWLLQTMLLSFSFLKVNLNGLKQFTFKGCNVCEICVDKVIMSKSQYCANFIHKNTFWVLWFAFITMY